MLPPPSPSLVGNLLPAELIQHGDWCDGVVPPRYQVRLSRNYVVWLACSAVDVLGQAASWAVRPGGWLRSTVPVGEVKSSSLLAFPVMVHWPSWT